MLRYCVNCKKDYEFPPLAVSGDKDLICPGCSSVISKNSRHPVDREAVEKREDNLGKTAAGIFNFFYRFHMVLGVIGVISYIAGVSGLLYAVTAIALAAFFLRFFTGTLIFVSGLLFLPAGAVIGYMYFGTIEGACLGIHIVFLIRHLIRDVFFTLIAKLIQLGN